MGSQDVSAEGRPGAPRYLRCESLTDPLGIEVREPRLSWTEDSLPLRRLESAAAEVQFRRVPRSAGGTVPP